MITDIDYNKLLRWMIPVKLRQAKTVAWLKAFTAPLAERLYKSFKHWEAKCWYDLKYQSGQVAYLEYVLNERFDPALKRIYIGPGQPAANAWVYIYTDVEDEPVWLYTDAENEPVYLYTDGELAGTGGGYDFVINVPVGLPYEEITLRAVADRYKRDGKNYIINYF